MMNKPLILVATGHRPKKLGGYSPEAFAKLRSFAACFLQNYNADYLRPRIECISGMALGWDMALAEAALSLGLPLIAAIPFKGQEYKWPGASQLQYRTILERCSKVHIVSEGGYAPEKMQLRNEWMVDNGDRVIALWDGSNGGTANCIRYAESVGKPIINLWEHWKKSPL